MGPVHGQHAIRSRRRSGALAGIFRIDQEQSENNLQLAAGNVHTFTPTTINEVNVG